MTVDESGLGLSAVVQICTRLNRAARIRYRVSVGG